MFAHLTFETRSILTPVLSVDLRRSLCFRFERRVSDVITYCRLDEVLTSTHPFSYDGVPIVQRSIDIGEPVIYVAMNYRYVDVFERFR